MKHIFSVFVVTIICRVPVAGQDTLVLRDLTHAWLSVNQGSDRHLIQFEVPALEENEALFLSAEEPVDIWINSKLLVHQFASQIFLGADSLEVYGPGTAWVRIFSKRKLEGDDVTTRIIKIMHLPSEQVAGVPQARSGENAGYLIILTVMMLLMGVYRHFFPITYNQSIQNPLSHKIRSFSADKTYVNFGSIDNLFSLFFFGGLVALLFAYLGYGFDLWGEDQTTTLINWLGGSMVVILVIFGKYVWARLVAFLYQFRGIPNIQVQDFVHFFTLIFLIASATSLIDFSTFGSTGRAMEKMIVYLLILSLVFFQIWFFLKFDKFHTHRKLMIFSYLCTTEFLPGFLAIYWLMKM